MNKCGLEEGEALDSRMSVSITLVWFRGGRSPRQQNVGEYNVSAV